MVSHAAAIHRASGDFRTPCATIPDNFPQSRGRDGVSMIEIGPILMHVEKSAIPYTFPVLSAAGLAATSLAMIDITRLTTQAGAALGLAGLIGGGIVGGVVYAINKYDQVKIGRQKLYDDANKDSLSEQLKTLMEARAADAAASLENQVKMRESLHTLRNEAQVAKGENYLLSKDLSTLRDQFMAVSKQLHETDMLLHTARAEMHAAGIELQKTLEVLRETVKDRDALRIELGALRAGHLSNTDRLDKLESANGSGDNLAALATAQNTAAHDRNTESTDRNTEASAARDARDQPETPR